MSKEFIGRVGNTLNRKKAIVALGASSLILAGCVAFGVGHDPNKTAFCNSKEAKNPVAKEGSKNENDPNTILHYAEQNSYVDLTDGWMDGINNDPDYIDGLGEIVCQVRSDQGKVTLHFLSSVNRIRHAYL